MNSSPLAILLFAVQPTFYRDVLPILQDRCQSCHRPGEIGPMPLLTYGDARPWAKAIREQVKRRKMPPWFADPAVGRFSNDPSLTATQIETIDRWAVEGAREGFPADAPPARRWAQGWNIGVPDAVIAMPQAFHVPPTGVVDYQFVILPAKFDEDLWVTMAEIRPGDRRVIHHAVLYVRERDSDWLRDEPVGVPFVPQGKRVTTSDILAIYTPGHAPMVAPAGMAKKIPAGASLVLQIHYTPSGKPAADQTRVGLAFQSSAPERRILTLQINSTAFRIPAGAGHYRVTAAGTLPNDALLLGMFPHMHLRGAEFEYEVNAPGGIAETLLHVKPYDFYWQIYYQLAAPRLLRKGAQLRVTAWYDNSPNNPRNPDPGKEVTYGEQSDEEMMVGFFDVAVPAGATKELFFKR